MRPLSILLILFIFQLNASAQYNGKDFSIGAGAVYTTTAKVFLSPNSSDIVLRNNSFPIEDILNPSLDFRYRLTNFLVMGLNVEYMIATDFGNNLTVFSGNNTERIRVEDGFRLIPVELTLHYVMPFSTELFKFIMGAGVGYYHGEHIRKIGNAETENAGRKIAYGIHVSLTFDYLFRENIILRGEMKFRDPQFNLTSSYTTQDVIYNGRPVRLPQDTFDSKVNVDGVTFILGVAYQF